MKLSISNIAWAAQEDERVYGYLNKYGYSGLEIAPTRIFPEQPYKGLERAQKWSAALQAEYGLAVSSMQSIWFGRTEKLFGSAQEREALTAYTKAAIGFAAAVGCKNLVFGCPKNRAFPEDAEVSSKRAGIEFFRTIGAYAAQKGTAVGMEANPAIYHTNYINTTPEALELIQEVGSDGFLLNLDIGTMIQNGEAAEALEGAARYISHVHVSEPHLAPIVMSAERRHFHSEVGSFLRENGYEGYVSIEMGRVEGLSLILETLDYVREVFG